MALEEIIVSYFDRMADRMADRIVQRLGQRAAVAGVDTLAAIPTVAEGDVGRPAPERRPIQRAPTQDRPQPGGHVPAAAAASGHPVTDSPDGPPPSLSPITPPSIGVAADGRRAIPNADYSGAPSPGAPPVERRAILPTGRG